MNTQSETRPKGGIQSLTRLLPYAKHYRLHFFAVLALVFIYNAASVLQPYLVKMAIDNDIASRHPNIAGLYRICLWYALLVVIGVVANYAQIMVLQHAGQNIIREIRLALFRHIEHQSMAFFDRNAIGKLVTNVSSDTETVSQFFTQFFLSLIRDGLSIVMIIVAMFRLNAAIAAESMVIIPLIALISWLFRARLRNAYQRTRTRLSNVVAFLAENLAGVRIIQIFHQEKRQAEAFEELNASHRQASVTEYGVSVMFNRALELLGNVAVAAVVYIGGGAFLHRLILFGTLYAFITYIRQFFGPINTITQQWNTLQSSVVAAERIGIVFGEIPAIVDADQTQTLSVSRDRGLSVEFHDVSFAYVPTEPVLHHISFRIDPGAFVGFVGATGAGKSSIMSLLARFYEVTEGKISLGGVDIRNIKQRELHQMVGLVQQDAYLFTGTVLDNIRLFRKDIPRELVIHAAETVGAHEVIERLPAGYDTVLHGKGANLSMGERQLISFARVVLQNPRVLILDEATANLDSQTEEWVGRGLATVSANRTTLVIAHRLSTVRSADFIVVLDKGRIVEQGTHEELLVRGGYYAELHEKSGVMNENQKLEQHT